jgi:phosphopantothenoylcysteine decarboxylase
MSNVLLGVTGSVAAVRTPLLYESLRKSGLNVRIVATGASTYFFDTIQIDAGKSGVLVLDDDEWPGERYRRGDNVLHIELRRWADLLVVAPLDANTLAKLSAGICDNCLTCVWRAWDPARPVVLAPAMNTLMWLHPITRRHLRQLGHDACAVEIPPQLDEAGIIDFINQRNSVLRIVPPQSKELACGDVGLGAMAEVSAIVDTVLAQLGSGNKR